MGRTSKDRRPLAWQGSLGQMKVYGTQVAQTCTQASCWRWAGLDLDALIAELGPDHVLWDRRPDCPMCGRKGHYMETAGAGTPFRPLLSGPAAEAARRAFLKGFGFTRRDIARIKAMAEAASGAHLPAALNDLDVPYRVGCCMPGTERHSSGQILGEWAGRVLLWWSMNRQEEEVWRRRRRHGPKPMP